MNTCDLSQQFFNAALLPRTPGIDNFKIKKDSEMDKIVRKLENAGVACYKGRASVFVGNSNKKQEAELKKQGIDISSQKLLRCSARKP